MNPILFRSLYLSTTYETEPRPKPELTFADRKGGFPHSEISGSRGARTSPELIAACHVLHRLSTPRHPLEALMRLIVLSKTHAWGRFVSSAVRKRQRGAHTCALSLDDVISKSSLKAPGGAGVTLHSRCQSRQALRARRETCALFPNRSRMSLGAPRWEAWWSQTGSNRRPHACKARALPTELWPPVTTRGWASGGIGDHAEGMVGPGRLELPTSRLSGVRSNQLSYGPKHGAARRQKEPLGSRSHRRLVRSSS